MKEQKQVKHIIIGAGLSGLTTAYQLHKSGEEDFLVLESRDRIGGRIYTSSGIDLGATWFQSHHTHLSQLLKELEVEPFPQYQKGNNILVYSTMAPAHQFESDPNSEAANRITGGSKALIDRLAKDYSDRIVLNTRILSVQEDREEVLVSCEDATYKAASVVMALPPKLAALIEYQPSLPDEAMQAMRETHTWMSNAIKVGITYQQPFWREKGLSGTILGQVGPVVELYDHSNAEESSYSLMGFVNEALRDRSPEDRKEMILSYVAKNLGSQALDYLGYQEKDWSVDANTSDLQLKSIYMSPRYGHRAFSKSYLKGMLLFSGAETSPVHGGYMDGAVYSGIQAAAFLLQTEKKK